MKLTEPDEILTEFLRAEVAEVANTKHTNTSESFNGTGSQDTFTLTNTKLLCINSVVVDAVTMTKYLNFDIDLDNNKIVFKSGQEPGGGTNNVVIDYDYNANGSTWIYPDKPRDNLTKTSYPRISVLILNNPGELMGLGETDTWHDGKVQIDILTYKGLKATISSEIKEGQDIVNYLGRQIKSKMIGQKSKIANYLEVLGLLENHPFPYAETKNQFRKIQSYSFQGKNIGDPV